LKGLDIKILKKKIKSGKTNLTHNQQRFCFFLNMDSNFPSSDAYFFEANIFFDKAILQQSIAFSITNFPIFRSIFINIFGSPIRKTQLSSIISIKLDNLYQDNNKIDKDQWISNNKKNNTINISQGPLFNVFCLKHSDKKFNILFLVSRLVSNKKLIISFMKNIFFRYQNFLYHNENEKIISYERNISEKFFYLENQWIETENFKNHIKFWKKEVKDLSDLDLQTDFKRPEIKTNKQKSVFLKLGKYKILNIFNKIKKEKYNYEEFFLSIFVTILYKYSNNNNFAVGVKANKLEKYFDKNNISPIENELPFKINLNSSFSFKKTLSIISEKYNLFLRYSTLPIKILLDNIGINRDLKKTPFFQVSFQYENFSFPIWNNKKNNFLKQIPILEGINIMDFTFCVIETKSSFILRIDFNPDLFLDSSMILFLSAIEELLMFISNKSWDISIKDLSIISNMMFKKIEKRWNAPKKILFENFEVHKNFENQCKKTPSNIAIICQGETITYRELNERANQISHYLIYKKLSFNEKIGILMDRSIEFIISILAILKINCIYVPIDEKYPIERINYIINDSQIKLLITKSYIQKNKNIIYKNLIYLDKDWPLIEIKSRENLNFSTNIQKNGMYMIYTSGSTGQAKGVILNHFGVLNNISWRQNKWHLNEKDRILLNTSFSFDPSIWSIFWPLLFGGAFVIVPLSIQNDIYALIKLIKKYNISIIGTIPHIIDLLVSNIAIRNCNSLRLILSGGEPLSQKIVQKVFNRTNAKLFSLYGPTEATIDAGFYECKPDDIVQTAPIGKAIDNTRMYILDENLRHVPDGVKGEIYISGPGVALGYHKRKDLNAKSFLKDNIFYSELKYMYKTGDLGVFCYDDNIKFLGRIDNQVKIYGNRIECSEIESVLINIKKVKESAVIVDNLYTEKTKLIAFLAVSELDVKKEDIQKKLKNKLPKYMLPDKIILLISLPKLENGKIDKNALFRIYNTSKNNKSELLENKLPSNSIEKIVFKYFCDVLSLSNISIHDDFFKLGGTSILLARLSNLLFNHFDISLPLHQFFKIPTVLGVSNIIVTLQKEGIDKALLDKHISKLEEDAELIEDISPKNLPKGNFYNPKNILITGSTGYIGSFILQELLINTNATIYCLIRSENPEKALIKLKNKMKEFYIWKEVYTKRIVCLVGDLGEKNIGLNKKVWENLSKKIEVIFHAGALVNFAYPYSALKAANVEGTKEIFRFSCKNLLKSVHYISTIDVLLATHIPRPFLENDAPLKGSIDIPGGYTGSKWVAEKIAHSAMIRGIPTSIYRPGLVMSHSKTGATQTNDYLLVAFKGFIPKKVIPEYARIFDIVPVDFVAKSIVYASMQKNVHGKFYHIFNPKPTTLYQFCNWIKNYGYSFDIIPFEIGRKIALDSKESDPLYPLVPLIRDADPNPHRPLDPKYINEVQPEIECKNMNTILQKSGIICPNMNERLTHLCLKYLINIGYFPHPKKI